MYDDTQYQIEASQRNNDYYDMYLVEKAKEPDHQFNEDFHTWLYYRAEEDSGASLLLGDRYLNMFDESEKYNPREYFEWSYEFRSLSGAMVPTLSLFNALEWYEQSANNGNGSALYRAGVVNLVMGRAERGQEQLRAFSEGVRQLSEASVKGHKDAAVVLVEAKFLVAATLLSQPDEVYEDDSTFPVYSPEELKSVVASVLEWLQDLASEGLVEAQFNLGLAYRQGLYIERNNDSALSWFAKASEQGDEQATANLNNLRKNNSIEYEAVRTRNVEKVFPKKSIHVCGSLLFFPNVFLTEECCKGLAVIGTVIGTPLVLVVFGWICLALIYP